LHHDHKKRGLQVIKKGLLIHEKGEWSKSMMKARSVKQGNDAVNGFMRVHLVRICYLRITLVCV
jgi:hypothetical protein